MKDGGRLALDFDGSNDGLLTSGTTLMHESDYTAIFLARTNNVTSTNVFISGGSSGTKEGRVFFHLNDRLTQGFLGASTGSNLQIITANTQNLYYAENTGFHTGETYETKVYIDGGNLATATGTGLTTPTGTSAFGIGFNGHLNSDSLNGKIQETIIYPSVITANRTDIEGNISAYYQSAKLLDEQYGSGAEAAYSVRQLKRDNTECMVIRRASDSTTTTIGFDGSGNIDEAAINTFCTGTTCTVYQWLDQSGNGNTATAAAPANEPTIYTGGALVKENGKLALEFFNDRLDALFSSKTLTTQSSFSVASIVIGSRYDRLFTQMLGANTDVPSYIPMVRDNLNNVISSYVGSFVSPLTFTYGTPFLFNSIHSGSTLTNYLNGSSGASVNNTLSETIDRYVIGARPDAIDNELNGTVQELIIYDSDKSGTDQTSIEENVGDYFTQNTPLLDTYSGAAAAYSLRLLDSSV